MSEELREHMLKMIQSEGDFSYNQLNELEFLSWASMMEKEDEPKSYDN